jgi:hypothetical protein
MKILSLLFIHSLRFLGQGEHVWDNREESGFPVRHHASRPH